MELLLDLVNLFSDFGSFPPLTLEIIVVVISICILSYKSPFTEYCLELHAGENIDQGCSTSSNHNEDSTENPIQQETFTTQLQATNVINSLIDQSLNETSSIEIIDFNDEPQTTNKDESQIEEVNRAVSNANLLKSIVSSKWYLHSTKQYHVPHIPREIVDLEKVKSQSLHLFVPGNDAAILNPDSVAEENLDLSTSGNICCVGNRFDSVIDGYNQKQSRRSIRGCKSNSLSSTSARECKLTDGPDHPKQPLLSEYKKDSQSTIFNSRTQLISLHLADMFKFEGLEDEEVNACKFENEMISTDKTNKNLDDYSLESIVDFQKFLEKSYKSLGTTSLRQEEYQNFPTNSKDTKPKVNSSVFIDKAMRTKLTEKYPKFPEKFHDGLDTVTSPKKAERNHSTIGKGVKPKRNSSVKSDEATKKKISKKTPRSSDKSHRCSDSVHEEAKKRNSSFNSNDLQPTKNSSIIIDEAIKSELSRAISIESIVEQNISLRDNVEIHRNFYNSKSFSGQCEIEREFINLKLQYSDYCWNDVDLQDPTLALKNLFPKNVRDGKNQPWDNIPELKNTRNVSQESIPEDENFQMVPLKCSSNTSNDLNTNFVAGTGYILFRDDTLMEVSKDSYKTSSATLKDFNFMNNSTNSNKCMIEDTNISTRANIESSEQADQSIKITPPDTNSNYFNALDYLDNSTKNEERYNCERNELLVLNDRRDTTDGEEFLTDYSSQADSDDSFKDSSMCLPHNRERLSSNTQDNQQDSLELNVDRISDSLDGQISQSDEDLKTWKNFFNSTMESVKMSMSNFFRISYSNIDVGDSTDRNSNSFSNMVKVGSPEYLEDSKENIKKCNKSEFRSLLEQENVEKQSLACNAGTETVKSRKGTLFSMIVPCTCGKSPTDSMNDLTILEPRREPEDKVSGIVKHTRCVRPTRESATTSGSENTELLSGTDSQENLKLKETGKTVKKSKRKPKKILRNESKIKRKKSTTDKSPLEEILDLPMKEYGSHHNVKERDKFGPK